MRARTWAGAAVLTVAALMLGGCGGGSVDATEADYSIGGSVTGLTGSVELSMNYVTGTETLTRTSTGTYSFATKIKKGGSYTVTVRTQPAGQQCSVSSGASTVGSGNVTNIAVDCLNLAWSVSRYTGSATGAAGSSSDETTVRAPNVLLTAPYYVTFVPQDGSLWVLDQAAINSGEVAGGQSRVVAFATSGTNTGRSFTYTSHEEQVVALTTEHPTGSGRFSYYITNATQVKKVAGGTTGSIYAASAALSGPRGMVRDSAGNLYISDATDHVIKKISTSGAMTIFAGSPGNSGFVSDTGALARFNTPWGLAIDSANNIYVADKLNNAIRKITPGAEVTTLAGSGLAGFGSTDGTGSGAKFGYPEGVAVDASGYVYVADTSNNLIRKISSDGVVTTIAGQAGNDGAGLVDGLALSAKFNGPASITIDGSGNFYIADRGNNSIRKLVYGPVPN